MIKLKRIKKDFGPCNYQFTLPNKDVVEVEVQRNGNKRIFSVTVPVLGALTFPRLTDLKIFVANYFGI